MTSIAIILPSEIFCHAILPKARIRIHPEITTLAVSCCEKTSKLLLSPARCNAVLIKYAAAPAITASVTQSAKVVSVLVLTKSNETPVAKNRNKCHKRSKNLAFCNLVKITEQPPQTAYCRHNGKVTKAVRGFRAGHNRMPCLRVMTKDIFSELPPQMTPRTVQGFREPLPVTPKFRRADNLRL